MGVKPIHDSSQIGSQVISVLQARETRAKGSSAAAQTEEAAADAVSAKEEAKQMVGKLNEALAAETNIRMYYDDDIDQVIVTVVDAETEEVLRQIPPEDFVSFAKSFDRYLGTLYNGRV